MTTAIEPWLREAAEDTVDPFGALELLFRPGTSIIFSGERGGGKTHCAVGCNELAVKLHPGSHLFTNVIFKRLSFEPNGYWEPGCKVNRVKDWPDEVTYVTSLEKVFRLTGEILDAKNDWYEDDDFAIYELLDEFQNFIMADKSYEPLVQAFFVYEGNLRKFKHCCQKISPSIYNIPKRLRRFVDDISYAGYLSAHIHKEKFLVEDFNRCWGTRIPFKYFASVKIGYDHKEELLEVPTVTWNRPETACEDGDIIYDHLSSATFRLNEKPIQDPKEELWFGQLIDKVGGEASFDVATVIQDFWERWDRGDDYDQGMDSNYELATRIREMRRLRTKKGDKLTWEQIARIESKPRSTVQTIYSKYAPQLDLDLVELEELNGMKGGVA